MSEPCLVDSSITMALVSGTPGRPLGVVRVVSRNAEAKPCTITTVVRQ